MTIFLKYHYDNSPIQYTAIFHGDENYNFQMTIVKSYLFFAENIYRGYTFEPPP